jgi:hypothetical protein
MRPSRETEAAAGRDKPASAVPTGRTLGLSVDPPVSGGFGRFPTNALKRSGDRKEHNHVITNHKIKSGNLTAVIWRNLAERGNWYSVTTPAATRATTAGGTPTTCCPPRSLPAWPTRGSCTGWRPTPRAGAGKLRPRPYLREESRQRGENSWSGAAGERSEALVADERLC